MGDMRGVTPCSDQDRVKEMTEELSHGRLSPDEIQWLESHMEMCSACHVLHSEALGPLSSRRQSLQVGK